jgi:nitrite reductase/ring-hydroxylating ferredoxin subunit/multimeric flavodoxin WrbA
MVGDVPPNKSKGFQVKLSNGSIIEIALFNVEGQFYAISNTCQHQRGPLSKGILDGLTVTCPWHGWRYSILDGKSPHEGGDSVDAYETSIVNDAVFVNPVPMIKGERKSKPHSRYIELQTSVEKHLNQVEGHDDDNNNNSFIISNSSEGRTLHVLGISTTNTNDKVAPRRSTSEAALAYALDYSKKSLGAETILVKLRQLYFKDCEGYYSKDARACIFPCSISEMDKEDQMIEIYEKMIIWADVVVIATPIRWGSASSLYYKMVQRLNCVQNQMITHDNVLIRDKVGAFIITGGQDNVQHVAGEMLSFWSQLGFLFGKFPYVGWTRGWYAEDTENNYHAMKESALLKKDLERTMKGALELSDLVRRSRYDKRLAQGTIT